MAKSKNKMSTIISELQNASKMHLRQSKELASHVKDMESPANMNSPLNKDNDWIQGVTKEIKAKGTEGVCTGDKFGGPTCPPGSKRYNLAKTFKKMASPATMKSPLNVKKKKVLDHTNTTCWKGHAPKPGEPKTKISSKTGRRVNNCS